MLFKIVKAMKTRLRNCCSPEGTRLHRLSKCHPGPGRGYSWEDGDMQIKAGVWLTVVSAWQVLSCDHCAVVISDGNKGD